MANAHVAVHAPQQHLLAPILGAVNDLRVGFLRAELLLTEVCKRMAAAGPQLQALTFGFVPHHFQVFAQCLYCLTRIRTHRGDQLNGVLQKLTLQVRLRVRRVHRVNHIGSPWHQVAGLRVNDADLPLHAESVGLRAGKIAVRIHVQQVYALGAEIPPLHSALGGCGLVVVAWC